MIRHQARLIALSLILAVITLMGSPAFAAIVGTTGDDLNMLFQGTVSPYNETLTNPYSGETFITSGTYNVNNETYDGLAGIDRMYGTTDGDVLRLRDASNNQTFFNIEIIMADEGDDVIDLSDATFVLDAVTINAGEGNDLVWGNVGNDYIYGLAGNDIINGGPGDDVIFAGPNDAGGLDDADILYGGPGGNDTLIGGDGDDIFLFNMGDGIDTLDVGLGINEVRIGSGITLADLTINYGPGDPRVFVGNGGDQFSIREDPNLFVRLRFDDGSVFWLSDPPPVPKPSTYAMAACGLAGLALLAYRRRR